MNMKKLAFIATLVALFTFSANAQLLWKVSGNGLAKPSYLFGTCHIATVKLTDSITGFNDALNACDAVYGEIEKADIDIQGNANGKIVLFDFAIRITILIKR